MPCQKAAEVNSVTSVRLTPQQSAILAHLRLAPGTTIRDLHAELEIPYESARTAVYRLMKYGLVRKRGTRPLYRSGLYVTDTPACSVRVSA
ncbi:MarR family transcriptional regulator [bacterium]|nr:MAG: MarR family transcriptional regulator [bacterium]